MNKTLIGKNNYLFLNNDLCSEIKSHCVNESTVNKKKLNDKFSRNNFMLIVFPDKCIYYKQYLPVEFDPKYRTNVDVYKAALGDRMIDSFNYIKNVDDCYYKTDTHINFKGNYIIYCEFIKQINKKFNLNLVSKNVSVQKKSDVDLHTLNLGIGDLTVKENLGDQILKDKNDNYYFSDDVVNIFNKYQIKKNDYIDIYNKNLVDITHSLVDKILNWNIVSDHILHKTNPNKKHRVLFFYDSFLLNIIVLYLEMFYEVFMIKDRYNIQIINKINPDYIFEFRVERFLNE